MATLPLPSTDDVDEIIDDLSVDALRAVVRSAAGRHQDVERQVRLEAARGKGDLSDVRAVVDRALRTRRFLGYRESREWAADARPVVTELADLAARFPSPELVELLQRAAGHVVKVILRADDSDGAIGDLASELLDAHALACDAGIADPVKLARWMVRFSCRDQDFFLTDPVRYRTALGERGLAAFRKDLARAREQNASQYGPPRFLHERLIILDGDSALIVTTFGGDLSTPHQFISVCEALAELGRDDEVLQWADRGIRDLDGWQVGKLYELACAAHLRRDELPDMLVRRREHHQRMPSPATYGWLNEACNATDPTGELWQTERPSAGTLLLERDRGSFVDALLSEGDSVGAWAAASDDPNLVAGYHRRIALAKAIEPDLPAEALALYLTSVDETLEQADRRNYSAAIKTLKLAERAAAAADEDEQLTTYIVRLREMHRRRPTLIAMLDKAGLTAPSARRAEATALAGNESDVSEMRAVREALDEFAPPEID